MDPLVNQDKMAMMANQDHQDKLEKLEFKEVQEQMVCLVYEVSVV